MPLNTSTNYPPPPPGLPHPKEDGPPPPPGVMWHFRPCVGPREGKGEAANSDLVPLLGTPKNAGVM